MIHPRNLDFPSKSDPSVVHTVVTASILNDEFCTCPGWNFRGKCSHVDAWQQTQCDWVVPAEEAPDVTVCPLCGAPAEEFETRSEFV